MGIWRQIAEYLYIKKKDPNRVDNRSTKLMHGMNRISVLVFSVAIILMLYRLIKYLLR